MPTIASLHRNRPTHSETTSVLNLRFKTVLILDALILRHCRRRAFEPTIEGTPSYLFI